jgi:polar amino acid transport system substrate-binding protein
MDEAPTRYMLEKLGASQSFYQGFSLFSRQFHRAVKPGREELIATVNSGFSAISNSETTALRDKWMGASWSLLGVGKATLIGLLLVASMALLLLVWNFVLRQQVKRRTVELLEEHKRLTAIVNGVGAYIFIKDANYRFTFANRALCDLLNRPQDAIIGQEDSAFFQADAAARLRENDRRVIEQGEELRHVEQQVSLQGKAPRSYLATKVPLRDANGKITGLLGISTDITVQQQQEQMLRQLGDELSATLSAIPDLLFEVDETGRYCNIWSGSREDELIDARQNLIGNLVSEKMPPEAARTVMAAVA